MDDGRHDRDRPHALHARPRPAARRRCRPFGPLSMDMYLPGLPALGRDLDASASATQLTLTACLAGLALGQLVAGPVSDRVGRRAPAADRRSRVYAAASLACAFAPTIAVLIVACASSQGLAGAAGIVIARAIVRDLYSGDRRRAAASRSLMLVNGLAPILAPGDRRAAAARSRPGAACSSCSRRSASCSLAAAAGCCRRRSRPRPARRAASQTVRVRRLLARPRASSRYALASGLTIGGDVRLHRGLAVRAADDPRR